MSYQRQFPGNHIKCIAFIDPTNPALSINMRGVPPKKQWKGNTIPYTIYQLSSSRRRQLTSSGWHRHTPFFFVFLFFLGPKTMGSNGCASAENKKRP